MAGAPIPIHGRDHCPGGPDPIPCLTSGNLIWVRRRKTFAGGAQTITWGGDEPITFDDDVGSASPDWNDYFTIMSSSHIRLDVHAAVLMSAQMHWDVDFADDHLISLHDGYSWATGWTFQVHPAFESPSQAFSFPHRYEATQQLFLQAAVAGTTDRDIVSGYWEIWIWPQDWDGPAPSDEDE